MPLVSSLEDPASIVEIVGAAVILLGGVTLGMSLLAVTALLIYRIARFAFTGRFYD